MENYTLSYPAICYVGEDSVGMLFPDLPGLTPTYNDNNLANAVIQAQVQLAQHISDLLDGNDLLPEPTPLYRVRFEDPKEEGVIVTLVLVDVYLPLTTKVEVDLQEKEPALC